MVDLQELMASGRLSSEELTLHLLGRVRDHEAALNSLIAVNPDALVQAREADARRASGESLGALDGIPVTVKDNIETAGPMPTTGGAEILAGHVAGADAPVVVALRAAGAVIVGKANLSELAGAVVRTPGFSAVGGQTREPVRGLVQSGGIQQWVGRVGRGGLRGRQRGDRDVGIADRPGGLQRAGRDEAQPGGGGRRVG